MIYTGENVFTSILHLLSPVASMREVIAGFTSRHWHYNPQESYSTLSLFISMGLDWRNSVHCESLGSKSQLRNSETHCTLCSFKNWSHSTSQVLWGLEVVRKSSSVYQYCLQPVRRTGGCFKQPEFLRKFFIIMRNLESLKVAEKMEGGLFNTKPFLY